MEPRVIDGSKVRALRRALPGSPSVRAFAKRIGINFNTLSRIETGKSGASASMVNKLARGLGCRPGDISTTLQRTLNSEAKRHLASSGAAPQERRVGHASLVSERFGFQDWTDVPIMGSVPAGTPAEVFQDFRGKFPVPSAIAKTTNNHVAIAAHGDSMNGMGILDGDMLVVRVQDTAADGDVVVADVEGQGVTCKRFRKTKSGAVLAAANAHAKTIRSKFRILGVVIWRGGRPW